MDHEDFQMICDQCKKEITEDTKYADWLCLFNFLEFLYLQEIITEETFEYMVDKLLSFKKFALEEDDGNGVNLEELN